MKTVSIVDGRFQFNGWSLTEDINAKYYAREMRRIKNAEIREGEEVEGPIFTVTRDTLVEAAYSCMANDEIRMYLEEDITDRSKLGPLLEVQGRAKSRYPYVQICVGKVTSFHERIAYAKYRYHIVSKTLEKLEQPANNWIGKDYDVELIKQYRSKGMWDSRNKSHLKYTPLIRREDVNADGPIKNLCVDTKEFIHDMIEREK